MAAGGEGRGVRKSAAECIRQFLAGRVSCDHLLEEFRGSGDERLREAVKQIEEEARAFDRYAMVEQVDGELRARMEKLAAELES